MNKERCRTGQRIHYGWHIVVASIIITAAGIGIFSSTNSIFVKPICDSLGFSRGEFTFHRTIITLVSAFVMPFYGRIVQNHGVKKILIVSTLTIGLMTIGYSFATQLWHFYLIALIIGAFVNGANFMVVGSLINRWFQDKKGFASGLAYCGSGLGAAIMMPIAGQIMEQAGWRWTYLSLGILGILVLLPTILFIVKEDPESVGLKPYTLNKKASKEDNETSSNSLGITLREAFRMPSFWMLAVSFFLISMQAGGTNTHTVPYLGDLGYSTAFAASVFSFLMIVLTMGKVVLGMVYDRFGTLWGNILLSACCFVFPVLALIAHIPVVAWIYAFFCGLASTGVSVPVAVLLAKHYGNKHFPSIFSFCTMVGTFGSAISVPVMGAIQDLSGSYRWAWMMLFVFGALITIGLIGSNISKRKIPFKAIAEKSNMQLERK